MEKKKRILFGMCVSMMKWDQEGVAGRRYY